MEFQTKVPILKSSSPLDYISEVFSIGSCFAQNMAEKLDYFQFRNTVNQFGILFHPIAIENFIDFVVNRKQFTEDDIFFHNERWHCFDAHSELSHADPEVLIRSLNEIILAGNISLAKASHIIITYGTSWVYRKKDTTSIVANCHKIPQHEFSKEILSVETIINSVEKTIALIETINPSAKIIFTISPVRHLKDGFSENQWSKSNLISAVQQVVNQNPEILETKQHYFPSYEIMMDELRDYRFYAADMIHPSETAIEYIWERFSENWISDSSTPVMKRIENVRKGLLHRPFTIESQSYQLFKENLENAIDQLQKIIPHIRF